MQTKRKIKEIDRDFSCGEVGPRGYPLGIDENGDPAEWFYDGEKLYLSNIRRSERNIAKARDEFRDKIWWNYHRHMLNGGRVDEGGDDTNTRTAVSNQKTHEMYRGSIRQGKSWLGQFGMGNDLGKGIRPRMGGRP